MVAFSNPDRDVFLVKLEKMIDRGALLSRYSRTSNLDIREVYEKEFSGDTMRGEAFYKRVFLEYGDESVSELVTAQLAVQNISNILSKIIEEQRIGLSYLEKSSRYVAYNKKSNGSYLYTSPERIGITGKLASEYSELCDSLFDFYSANYKPAQDYFSRLYPMETLSFPDENGKDVFFGDLDAEGKEIAAKSYRSSVRARALDDLRALLPASTLTNAGISGNGRAFIYLIQRLKASRIPEAEILADDIFKELKTELPELIDASTNIHGEKQIRYLESLRKHDTTPEQIIEGSVLTEIVDWDREPSSAARVISIYEFSRREESLAEIFRKKMKMSLAELSQEISALAELRNTRRDRPPRAFEACSYLMQINLNYGAFRDLQRHRFMSIERPFLSDRLGYDVPPYFLSTSELSEEYGKLMQSASRLYRKIRGNSGAGIAQYAIPYAYRYPVSIMVNLRELVHFCELRSTPQSHYDLRKVSMDIYREVQEKTPALSNIFRFVDTGDYALGRLKSEQKKEKKLRNLK